MIWEWKCTACKEGTLGVVEGNSEGKTVVRIKRKDSYVEVRKGIVITNCIVCGKRNILKYNEEIKEYEKITVPLDQI